MQPRWLPMLRGTIGTAITLTAVISLLAIRPLRVPIVLFTVLWSGLGIFLIWASRHEHSGTLLEPDAITVTEGKRPRRMTREDILTLRADPAVRPWRILAVLRDGSSVMLLGVPPRELDRFVRWLDRI